jgi:hypothetical protein
MTLPTLRRPTSPGRRPRRPSGTVHHHPQMADPGLLAALGRMVDRGAVYAGVRWQTRGFRATAHVVDTTGADAVAALGRFLESDLPSPEVLGQGALPEGIGIIVPTAGRTGGLRIVLPQGSMLIEVAHGYQWRDALAIALRHRLAGAEPALRTAHGKAGAPDECELDLELAGMTAHLIVRRLRQA